MGDQRARRVSPVRSATEPPVPQQAETAITLARTLGNRAFGRLLAHVPRAALQREPVQDAGGNVTHHRFVVGQDVDAEFGRAVREAVADGAVGDDELGALRTAALAGDGSVSDHERLIMAALLDPQNARALSGRALATGEVLELPAGSITPERRARVDAADRPAMPPDVERLLAQARYELLGGGAADPAARFTEADNTAAAEIQRLTGPFAPRAADAVAVANRHGVSIASMLQAMLAAAADGTPGDIALAGVVLAIARAEMGHLFGELSAGRIRVDEVPPEAVPRPDPNADRALAAYVTMAQRSGTKGDTMYVPTDFDIANTLHWSTVVHELAHADHDLQGAGEQVSGMDAARSEVLSYRAQGAVIMRRLLAEPAATRPRVAGEVGAGWTDMVLLGMVLERGGDRARTDPLIIEVNDAAPNARHIDLQLLDRVLALDPVALETHLVARIRENYELDEGAVRPIDGLAGSSIVDWIDRL
jgi:hypothetical protein